MTFQQLAMHVAREAAISRNRPDLELSCRKFMFTMSEKYDPSRNMEGYFQVLANNYMDIRIWSGKDPIG